VWHERVRSWWEAATDDVLVPIAVLPEIAYLLSHRIGPFAERTFIEAVAAGEFVAEPLLGDDIVRSAELMATYSDTPLGFVDAAIAATAERLGVARLLTTDRRHFSLIRPRHVPAFRLLP
jgi:predicted nucleic acid-binding protein